MRATRAFIHLDNLASNIAAIRSYIDKDSTGNKRPLICLPVKAGAYGHGAVSVANAALKAGAAALAVATVDEGIELREAGINAPVLLFSPAMPDEWEAAAEYKLSPLLSGVYEIEGFARAALKTGQTNAAGVFLKIDTGMGRTGCSVENAAALAKVINKKGLRLAGCITHFAVADSVLGDNAEFTKRQLALFEDAVRSIRAAGIDAGIVSAANSGAVLLNRAAHLDMVRTGIAVYGYAAIDGVEPPISLLPVMELVTQVVLIKKILLDETVSYGRAWTAPCDTHIGVLPIGYADGLPRRLSAETGFFISIGNERYPLAGRICMDMCMVDLGTNLKVKLYDKAVIFGPNPNCLDAAALATMCGTIPYEITCGISRRVPRVYVQSC